MNNILYYNPECSKSREALALLKERGVNFDVFDYQQEKLTEEMLKEICALLDAKPIEIMRVNEHFFGEMQISIEDLKNENYSLKLLCTYPILLQRPIFVYNQKAVIGRPPERVLEILSD